MCAKPVRCCERQLWRQGARVAPGRAGGLGAGVPVPGLCLDARNNNKPAVVGLWARRRRHKTDKPRAPVVVIGATRSQGRRAPSGDGQSPQEKLGGQPDALLALRRFVASLGPVGAQSEGSRGLHAGCKFHHLQFYPITLNERAHRVSVVLASGATLVGWAPRIWAPLGFRSGQLFAVAVFFAPISG